MQAMLSAAAAALGAATWGDVLEFVIRLTLVAAAGCAILAALPRAAAALRHQIALATLAALLALPFASAVLPALSIPVLPRRDAPATAAGVRAPTLTTETLSRVLDSSARLPAFMAGGGTRTRALGAGLRASALDAVEPGVPRRRVSELGLRAGRDLLRSARGVMTSRVPGFPTLALMFLAALFVALILAARGLIAMFAVARIARDAAEVTDARMHDEFDRARARLGIRRAVALRATSRLAIPIVWGVSRPVLLLPLGARAWPRERLRSVLLHELAHVARHDGISLLCVRAATAVFWFHPLVWSIARTARRECEHACDDIVLAHGERPSSYAGHLLAVATGMWANRGVGDIAPALVRHSKLEQRVRAILSPDARRTPATRRSAAMAVLLALLIAFPVATARVVAAPAASARAGARTTSRAEVASPGMNAAAQPGAADATLEFAALKSGEAWFDTATDHYSAERYDAAAAAFVRAAGGGYRPATALYNAACSFALDGQSDQALIALERALDAGFDDPSLIASDDDLDSIRPDPRYRRLAGRARATPHAEQKKRSALSTSDALRTSGSRDAGEWNRAGLDLLHEREFARAIEAFETRYAIDSSASGLYNIACTHARAGEKTRALDMLERSIISGYGNAVSIMSDSDLRSLRREPRWDAVLDLAKDLELMGSWTSLGNSWGWRNEIPRYQRIAQKHPTLGRAWFNLGYAMLEGRDARGAVAAFLESIDLNYRRATSMYNLGCAYAQLREPDAAIQWLERAEAAGMKVEDRAHGDNDLDPLRSDPRFQRMMDRWERETKAAEREKEKDGYQD